MWEKKNKGTNQCKKKTVTCDVGTAQCESGIVKCEDLIIWHIKLPTSGYRTPSKKRRGMVELPFH